MRKLGLLLILLRISLSSYSQIIADHTVVDKYDDIPQEYIDKVKEMWLVYAGESHSVAISEGLILLESIDSKYQANTVGSGTPEAYTDKHLRVSRATWGDFSNSSGWIYSYGEEDWWTNATAVSRTKAGIAYCNTHNLSIAAIGYGWCSDMAYDGTVSSSVDPVYGCHWHGGSKEGPQGHRCWGLDAGDYSITSNTVNLTTYLSATQQYIDYCSTNGYSTKVFFTTGPVDPDGHYNTAEKGYQASLKQQGIRDYILADPSRILFDYADILCYDDNGTQTTQTWNGHAFPSITTTNLGDGSIGHIGSAGAIRLAKAMWWMLARISGWDGGSALSQVKVTAITVTGAEGVTTITKDNGTLQLSASVSPSNATNKAVTWSISNGTGQASISSTGLITAISNGTVTARATAKDGSGVYGTLIITISNQIINVTGIIVTGAGGATTITKNNGTLQLSASVSPSNATNKMVTWSISNGTGQASISSTGLATAISSGTVTARATAKDGSGVYGTMVINISNQDIPVENIVITSEDGTNFISEDKGTLQLFAQVTPTKASDKTVIWSVENITGQAIISATGLVTAIAPGTILVTATATDGSGAMGTIEIIIKINKPLKIVVNNNEMKMYLDESFESSRLSLYNLQGNLIRNMLVNSDLCVFDISTLPTGIYIVVLAKSIILHSSKVFIK